MTEKMEKTLRHISSSLDVDPWAVEEVERVFKAYEQIRAEIKALNPVDYVSMSSYEGHRGASDMKDDVLQIIDSYKGEQT